MDQLNDYKRYLEDIHASDHVVGGVTRLVEAMVKCQRDHEPTFSQFCDPEVIQVGLSVIGHQDLKILTFGGYEEAEYEVVGFAPDYMAEDQVTFPVALLGFTYPTKFGRLDHKDVLGALMSLGFERKMIGDILLEEGRVQFFAHASMADLICRELTQVKRMGVTVESLSFESFKEPDQNRQAMTFSVSSLRLDGVVAGAFNLSRTQVANLIKNGRVKVNYSLCDKVGSLVKSEDMISVRQHGRFYVSDVVGLSKKGKLRLSGEKISR